jgi:hypothetical protein
MQPHMTDAELDLFKSVLRCADHYLEFGSGGSTCLAAELARRSVVSVDSSTNWLDQVGRECAARNLPIRPRLVHADIGPIKDWGYPTDEESKPLWPRYHEVVWQEEPAASKADLYLVDGRFRVACFMQIVLHTEADALILFHDFALRRYYHVVREVAREVARTGELSLFLPRLSPSGGEETRARARDILERYAVEPA